MFITFSTLQKIFFKRNNTYHTLAQTELMSAAKKLSQSSPQPPTDVQISDCYFPLDFPS